MIFPPSCCFPLDAQDATNAQDNAVIALEK
jgi:hypothetical protein